MKFLFQIFLTGIVMSVASQPRQFTRLAHFSLAPGLSTNGMNHGGFTNYFSLNLTSGTSYSNFAFELALVSNQNVKDTRGLQIAGIANTTGTNAFERMLPREIDRLKREGFEANLSGVQVAGVANLVLNNVFGWQASGGVNIAKGALFGFQLSGVSNTVYRYAFGVQLAGLYNVAIESMDGVQVASLFNVTTGGLFGTQIALVNRAGFIQGKNSFGNDDPTGIQIGVINSAGLMNGFQIGLINISKTMQGTQLGLINIYRGGNQPMTRDGTSIGLINIGSSVKVRTYVSELFPANVEVSTGTFKNLRMKGDITTKDFQNALMYSWTPKFAHGEQWAIGYGMRKYFFNKSTLPGVNRRRYVAFGADWMHVSYERRKILKELSLVTRPHISVGSRIHPRNSIGFFFVGMAYNYYVNNSEHDIDAIVEGWGKPSRKHWPGFSAGFMVH